MKKIYIKYKEIINYLICGVIATIVSFVSYFVATRVFSIDEIISNAISWILSVICAYFLNKIFVFNSKTNTKASFIKEFVSFILARIVTGVLCDIIIFAVMIKVLKINDIITKIVIQIIVTLSNYVLSKLIIFKKK